MQIKIIAFQLPTELVSQCKRMFPSITVEHQFAVDLRKVDTSLLVKTNFITHSTAQAIQMAVSGITRHQPKVQFVYITQTALHFPITWKNRCCCLKKTVSSQMKTCSR